MALSPPRLLASLLGLSAGSASPTAYRVALSGGLDSSVLLHALTCAWHDGLPPLRAVHVNHGLQAEAEAWAEHCRRFCAGLGVELSLLRVDARARAGESPEATARHARYQALAELLQTNEALLTAHHRDDQAETLLLQLLRGAGPRGLAAMPPSRRLGAGLLLRPLLEYDRAELEAYARQHSLVWVEDPSNREHAFERNFLRHQVMPLLRQHWPGLNKTLVRSARACAEAAALNEQLAQQDLGPAQGEVLPLARLRALPPARRRNVLFHWLRCQGAGLPSAAQMAQLEQIAAAAQDATPQVGWGEWVVWRYRDALYLLSRAETRPLCGVLEWDGRTPLVLPGLGRLEAHPVRGRGLRSDTLEGCLQIRFRRGGERCRIRGQGHRRALKKLLQDAGVPPWQRWRIPLLFIDDQLAAVIGHWVCEPFAVHGEHQAGVELRLE